MYLKILLILVILRIRRYVIMNMGKYLYYYQFGYRMAMEEESTSRVDIEDESSDYTHIQSVNSPSKAQHPEENDHPAIQCEPTSTVPADDASSPGSSSSSCVGGVGGGTKFTAHVLPPCRVCGGNATGFHYGVNTCEACKGFYHRSIKRHPEYTCLQNAKCQVKPGRRNSCSYCRYQKCLEVGMSKLGIKTGRYTYEKRTKDIIELQNLKRKESEVHEKLKEEANKARVEAFVKVIMQNKDKLIESMMKATHKKYNPNFSEEEIEQGRMKLKCLVPQNDEGLDTEELVKKWMEAVESSSLRHIISFIKGTPGFTDIATQDQIQIIKASFCEIWIIGRHTAFDTKLVTFSSIHGIRFELRPVMGDDMTDRIVKVVQRIQNLKLSYVEMFLLMAFVVFTTDRCFCLANPASISVVHEQLLEALLYTMKKSHPEDSNLRFARINACLTELRTVSEMYHALTQKLGEKKCRHSTLVLGVDITVIDGVQNCNSFSIAYISCNHVVACCRKQNCLTFASSWCHISVSTDM